MWRVMSRTSLLLLLILCCGCALSYRFIVMTRAYYEHPYHSSFIQWYLALEFHHILIIQTDDGPLLTWNSTEVTVIRDLTPVAPDRLLDRYTSWIKFQGMFDWVLVVDLDELLLFDVEKYPSIDSFVQSQELLINQPIDVIQFRWAMWEHVSPLCPAHTVSESLQGWNVFASTLVKSMTRLSSLDSLAYSHLPILIPKPANSPPVIVCDGSVIHTLHSMHRITAQSYVDSALLHVHTRSLANLLLKATVTQFARKVLNNTEALVKLLHSDVSSVTLDMFASAVGAKATLPLIHAQLPVVSLTHLLPPPFSTQQSKFDFLLCDSALEVKSLRDTMERLHSKESSLTSIEELDDLAMHFIHNLGPHLSYLYCSARIFTREEDLDLV